MFSFEFNKKYYGWWCSYHTDVTSFLRTEQLFFGWRMNYFNFCGQSAGNKESHWRLHPINLFPSPTLMALSTFLVNFLPQVTAVASTGAFPWTFAFSWAAFAAVMTRWIPVLHWLEFTPLFVEHCRRLCTSSLTIQLAWNDFRNISGGNWIRKLSIIFSIVGSKIICSSHDWNRSSWHLGFFSKIEINFLSW